MIDINTILTQALTTAVAEAMLPLQQEYANKMGEMATRIAALEAQLAQLAAQATPAPAPDTQVQEAVYTYLDDSESFWHRIAEFVNTRVSSAAEQLVAEAIDAHLENASHLDEDDIGDVVENAIENHEENRTHGDEDDIERLVRKMLRNARISFDV